MNKTLVLRLSSVVLVLSLILSILPLGGTVRTVAAPQGNLILDSDVELDIYSADCWDTLYDDSSLDAKFTSTGITVSGTGAKILSLKQAIIEKAGGTLDRMSFVLQNNGWFDTKILAGKRGDEHIFLYSQNWTSGMYKKKINNKNELSLLEEGSEDGWVYIGNGLSPVLESNKVGVTVKYGDTVEVMLSYGDDFDNIVAVFKTENYENVPELYLTAQSQITELKVVKKQPVNYSADWKAFTKKYSDIINAQDVQISDEEDVRDALNTFEGFNNALKENKYETYLKLTTFLEKIKALKAGKSMDLSDLSLPMNWNALTSSIKKVKNDSEGNLIIPEIKNEGTDTLLLISPNKSILKKYGEVISKYSYEVKTASDKMGMSDCYNLVYEFADKNNYKYLKIWYYEPWGGWLFQDTFVTNGKSEITDTLTGLDLDFSDWVTVTYDVSSEESIIIVLEGNGKKQEITRKTSVESAMVLSSVNSETTPVKYRSFKFSGVNADDRRTESKIINNFKYRYSEILNLTDNMIFVNYEDDIDNALKDFEKLSDYSKSILKSEKEKLDSLKAKIVEMKSAGEIALPERAKDDYSEIYEDFESDFRLWSNYSAPSSIPETVYDEERQSNVLMLKGTTTIGPNSFNYPDNAFVKQISFKYKTDEKVYSAWYPLNFIAGWTDSNNYNVLRIYRINCGGLKSDGTENIWDVNLTSLPVSVTKGLSSQQELPNNYGLTADYDCVWLDVTMTFDKSGMAYVSVSDGKNTDIITMKSLVSGRPAFMGIGASSGSRVFSKTAYYDDIRIELEKGEYEQKTVVTRPTVYYTGNTAAEGDDVVTLQGENLYDTVSKVYIVKIPDESDCDVGYVKQMDFSSLGTESEYILPAAAADVWNSASSVCDPVRLDIYQHSDMQLKFIIPKEFGKGMFALKLEGFDKYTDSDDSVVLVNTPKISLALGSDGTSTDRGGTLKITGENIALYHVKCDSEDFIDDKYQTKTFINKNVRVALIKNGSEKYIFSQDDLKYKLEVVAEQYIKLYIPNDFEYGDYELSVYNGYGNGACWSMPYEQKVTVKASPRDSWPDRIFNVKNYGATGDREQNATPYIVTALGAISENGGGILYFPKGIYNMIHSIVIPENVKVIGEGVDKSILFWTYDQWAVGNCPTYLCGFTGNVSFCNLGIYALRLKNGLSNFETTENKNVYIENCRIYSNPWTGSPTQGGWTGYSAEYTDAELRIIIQEESKNDALVNIENTVNYRMGNTSVYKRFQKPISYGVKYSNFENCTVSEGWSPGDSSYTVYEKCEWNASTPGATGRSVLYYGCCFRDVKDNNRELWVADGSPTQSGGDYGLVIKKDTTDPEGCTYLLQNSSGKQENDWLGFQIYISEGQGIGQVRKIIYSNAEKLVIDSPFEIEPISECRVIIRSPREDMFFVNNFYKNGLATGFFGGFANVVYNSNVWQYTSDIYQEARFGDMLMYLTYENGYYFDAYQQHSYGSGDNDRSGFSYLQFLCDSGTNHIQNFTVRDNTFDGYSFWLVSSVNDGIRGITFDKNTFTGQDYAIEKYPSQTVMGIMMYKNIADECIRLNRFKDEKKDTYGSYRYFVYSDKPDSEVSAPLIGDVNGDGKITLKDSTLIRLYLSGLIEFTDEQKERADAYGDGKITMRDSTAIRYYLINGKFPHSGTESDGKDEYYEGNF